MPAFELGVNYWPRHQGLCMWKDFTPDDIDSQFAEMHKLGLTIVRLFTLWEDFQPVKEYFPGGHGAGIIGRRHAVDPRIDLECEDGYLDPEALKKFDRVLELARKHKLKLIPTLLVGWMSGGCFDPPHLNGRNIFTDPAMLRYQIVYFRAMARRYRDEPAIYAWDIGNEQNCYQPCASREAAWTWTYTLANTLRQNDPDHRVVSGMHGLGQGELIDNSWRIQDVAEHCDFTTVHPYPGFFPCCREEVTNPRTTYLPAWQNRLYEGVGGKPCMCQEFGALGDSYSDEAHARDYLRTVLPSLLSNGSMGAVWWCHTDFTCDTDMPYAMGQMETNGLGLMRADGSAKPVAEQFHEFSTFCGDTDVDAWQRIDADAAIVLPNAVDGFDENFASFILTRQAGINADIRRPDADLGAYKLLLLPSVKGHNPFTIQQWRSICDAIENGATALMTFADGALRDFDTITGARVVLRRPHVTDSLTLSRSTCAGDEFPELLTCHSIDTPMVTIEPTTGKVLATFTDGSAAVVENAFGKGRMILACCPFELALAATTGGFDGDETYKLYDYARKTARIASPLEYDASAWVERAFFTTENGVVAVLVNHSDNRPLLTMRVAEGFGSARTIPNGEALAITDGAIECELAGHDFLAIELRAK